MTDGFHMSTETADEQVAKPNAVRYAYDADVQCICFDADGVPLAPFELVPPASTQR